MSVLGRFHRIPAQTFADRAALNAAVASKPNELGVAGDALLALDLMLEDDGLSFLTLGGESERLSTDGCVALFPADAARAFAERLGQVALTRERVQAYLEAEGGAADQGSVDALRAALDALKAWLGRVGPNELGVLFVG